MSKTGDINCNLCGKSFSDLRFRSHFSAKHFPKGKFVCFECGASFSLLKELQSHLHKNHATKNEKLTSKNYSPKNLFEDYADVVRHAKICQSWVRFAFSYGFENPVDKKHLKSLVRNFYSDKIRNVRGNDLVCKSCDDANTEIQCYFCGENFNRICPLKCHILNLHLVLPSTLKMVIPCREECDETFRSKKLLEEHYEDGLNQEKNNGKPPISCQYCGKCLANKSNLKRHVVNQHSVEVGASRVINTFTCDYCKCCFSNKSSVKRHIENLHLKEKDSRKSISCYQCEQRFNSIKNLNAHLTNQHNIQISETKLQFVNISEFWNWKQEEEIRTKSRFIQLRGLRKQRRKGEEISTLKFVCNRSGIFHSKSNGKRAYRIKGSSKIGRYCSAYIEIMFKENASVNGIYCSTHSGHDNDLRYLALTMDEKREIYEKIKSGTTFSTILNEIRDSVGKEIKRKHLVTNKDLHNIVTTFKKLSKPGNEESIDNESSPNDSNTFPNNDLISSTVRSDRIFNNDLDICADLWVETCQRMINNLDQDQQKTSARNKANLKESLTSENNIVTDEDPHPLADDCRVKSSHPNYPNNFVLSKEYSSSIQPHSSVIQPAEVDTNHLWLKQSHYTTGSCEELNPQLAPLTSISSLQSNPICSPPSYVNKNAQDFCGVQNNMLGDLPMTKEFYSSDVTLRSSGDPVERTSCNDSGDSTVCSNGFCNLQSPNVNNSDTTISCLQNVDVYNKAINHNLSPLAEAFNQPYTLIGSEETLCDGVPSSSDELEDNINGGLELNNVAGEEDGVNSKVSIQNKSDNELSDLRDRVNSVTALYNIVESELDVQKKNIIRNYVDNMFRVLQYRYNKCKTKKKQSTNNKISSPLARRRLNSKLNSCSNNLVRMRRAVKPKTKLTSQSRNNNSFSLASTSTQDSSKINNSAENDSNYTVPENERTDFSLMHWGQY